MTFNWSDSKIEEFVSDYYEDLLIESWLPEHPDAWEVYAQEVMKPLGRPYVGYEEAPIGVWNSFVTWHKSQSRFHEPFVKWIEENLPEIEREYEAD